MIERKLRRKKADNTKTLIGLIAVLAVLLVAAIVVAVSMKPQPAQPTDGTTVQTEGSRPADTSTGLTMTNPAQTEFLWLEKTICFSGTSDPDESLTINGIEIPRDEQGGFSYDVQLQPGMNEVTVSHKGTQLHHKIEHRYAVESFSPDSGAEYGSGETMELKVVARNGSEVTAKLGSTSIAMKKQSDQPDSITNGFTLFVGTYKMPANNSKDQNLGKITFTVTCDGQEEVYTSGDIICRKSADVLDSDSTVTPDYGDYIDVGSGYVVKIVTYSAETFNGKTRDDYSDPRNNYLPEGTMDYGSTDVFYDPTGKLTYRLLRCGYRVYTQRKNYPDPSGKVTYLPVVECYEGSLPDHNEVGFASLEVSGSHTILTLDTMWKAPFYLDVKPVTYNDPGARDFKVTGVTAEYVDITFCYATEFEGTVNIPADNPLFKSAKLTQNEEDCTLRLYLKKTGGFYGWDCYYNDNDQLCFQFLNPTPATTGQNAYGADLSGLQIMIDVGHGGVDGGSAANDANGNRVEEADINMDLAVLLKEELESMGATVIMNRTDDANLTVDQRIQSLKNQKPDYCIAIHHNSYAALASVNGCDVMYFGPQSKLAAEAVYEQIKNSGVYKKTMLKWNTYYMARETVCPVVLVECGYMTNPDDLAGALNQSVIQQKAKDMAKGVANYFLNQ